MANSLHKLSLAALAVLACAAPAAAPAAPAAPAAQQPDRSKLPITVEADSSDFDYRNEALRFRNVRITQGEIRIEAQQAAASGLDFENSRWQFEGTVRITVTGGFLSSDKATVDFRDNLVSRADIVGRPAQFEQKRETQLARGRAARIDYDLTAGTVKLVGDAWLSDGRNEITGPALTYDLGAQRVLAESSAAKDRVRIVINPKPRPEPEPPRTPP
jgi:lipopolysaccharide export system protein LptA